MPVFLFKRLDITKYKHVKPKQLILKYLTAKHKGQNDLNHSVLYLDVTIKCKIIFFN